MTKITQIFIAIPFLFALETYAAADAQKMADEPKKIIETKISIPYERPIGFTINTISIASMTFEGRFFLGLFPNVSLVVSPSYQNTPELPLYHPQREEWSLFDIKRFNVGLGMRGHFYEYDSWDGLFIELMGRGGLFWVGKEETLWSVIPSLIFGYAAVYDSGYTVSFGLGLEWEFLFGESKGNHTDFLRTAYYGITKVPLTGELSLGWTW